ncbi:MAG: sigma-70 family RNA polymerase sigma factor [Armatimonadota bacterium]
MTDIDEPTTKTQQLADQSALFRAYRQSRDSALRDQLVCTHLELVHSVARRFMGLGESLEDLVQEGSIGLLNAVDLFDPDRGVKFSTYACHLIIGQIQHYLRDRGRLIRQPAWVQELNTKVARATEQLFQQLGRDPQVEEIAAHLHLSEDVVQNVISARELNRVVSLNAPTDSTGENEPSLQHEKLQIDRPAELQLPIEDKIVLDEAINTLKALEQKVVRLFYFGELNQSEIARKLGISVNYASYLLRRSLMKIKAVLDDQNQKEAILVEQERNPFSLLPIDIPPFDPLTSLYSGGYLRARVTEEIARSRRYPTNFALMLLSLHGLEPLEDDRLPMLTTFSQSLRNGIRTIDLASYLGDGRFALLLPHTGREAHILGERLCDRLAQQGLPNGLTLTVNAGFAVFPLDGATMPVLFDRAGQALAMAAKAGAGAVACISNTWKPVPK